MISYCCDLIDQEALMPALDARSKTLGILWLISAVVCFVKAAWIALEFPILTLMWGALLNRVPNPFAWMSDFHAVLMGIIVWDVVAGIFAIMGGLAWMQNSRSTRSLLTVASLLALITGPIGLMLGAYTLAAALSRIEQRSATVHSLPNAA
jgi:hypothetical protein